MRHRTAKFGIALGFLGALLVGGFILGSPEMSAAQEKKDAAAEEEDKETLRTGVVASQGNFRRGAAIDAADSTEAAGDEPNPVQAKVSRRGDRCVVSMTNNGKNKWSIRYKVVLTDKRGRPRGERNFSASIKPGASVDKLFACDKGDNGQVVITSGRKLKG